MVTFTVISRKATSPTTKGVMLNRGDTIVLDPDEFESHAALAAKLRLKPKIWRETDGLPTRHDDESVDEQPAPDDGLLPHQRELIQRLKSQYASSMGDPAIGDNAHT